MFPTIKQSTALTIPFFAYDVNGDGVTGKADGDWTKRIIKEGGAFGAMTVTITELENGWYSCPLSTSHTDTLGMLAVSLSATGVKRVNLLFRVGARIMDDLAFPVTSGRGIDVDASGGVEVGSFQAGAINAAAVADGAIDAATFAAGAINAAAIADGAIDAATFAAGAIDAAAIAVGAIASDAFAAGAIDAAAIGVGAIAADAFAAGAIDAAAIANGAIDAATFAAGAIDAAAIADAAIDAATFAAGAINAAAIADAAIDAATFAADAVSADAVSAAGANKIADHTLRRTYANARGSANGDAVAFRSLLGGLGKLVNRFAIAAGTLTVYQEDDTTSTAPGGTQTVTTASGNPIVEIDTD